MKQNILDLPSLIKFKVLSSHYLDSFLAFKLLRSSEKLSSINSIPKPPKPTFEFNRTNQTQVQKFINSNLKLLRERKTLHKRVQNVD